MKRMANEKRLIWDEDAKRHLIALAVGYHSETLHIDMILNAILRHTTTVDAVEVVRCKDCKHYKPQNKSAHWEHKVPYCMRLVAVKVKPDDFCSYGERRNE